MHLVKIFYNIKYIFIKIKDNITLSKLLKIKNHQTLNNPSYISDGQVDFTSINQQNIYFFKLQLFQKLQLESCMIMRYLRRQCDSKKSQKSTKFDLAKHVSIFTTRSPLNQLSYFLLAKVQKIIAIYLCIHSKCNV